ncbi:acetyl-CoA carboxylase biotin carboxyl carrier protein [Clostridium acidisoli DSM 12555]|uniref:Biotin carboxyl carrier protein of acetyl-CoA carboxylase n=1 Tax=Clostridium acidisoli DSM 12555 TaxID=1121291 RepID=A0A1W1XJL4_9CLOT|nr:biotin/lipoyl-containing protein [Clostridium acidisoli]SMC24173.1 acetyl-CoA carboxylase biotin carboxyl carrier protein [Clostridium acidisoli DSM 12555]
MINIEDLDKIMEIANKHSFSRFEFEQENSRVVIERENSIKKVLEEDKSVVKSINKEIHIEEKNYIKSSLAGTFYLKKEENAAPLVKLHDVVEENTVIGLIEVMKLFNEVEAGVSGEIVNILVKDGEFVEYGQPLFEVKGSDK